MDTAEIHNTAKMNGFVALECEKPADLHVFEGMDKETGKLLILVAGRGKYGTLVCDDFITDKEVKDAIEFFELSVDVMNGEYKRRLDDIVAEFRGGSHEGT